jgi:hypothetical protein
MPGEISAENIKKVIDVVRKKRLTSTELEKETGISERTLRRILSKYLCYWELVAKDKAGNWAWYETTRVYATNMDLEIAREHSRKLIQGLAALGASFADPELYAGKAKEIAIQEASALKEAAEDHIRTGYPSISAQITNLNNLNAQRKNLYENATGQPAPNDWPSLLRDLHYLRKYQRAVPKKLPIPKENLKMVQKLIEKIPADKLALIDKLEEELQIGDYQTYKDIRDLERKIEHGEPLQGKCKLCPAISVSSN